MNTSVLPSKDTPIKMPATRLNVSGFFVSKVVTRTAEIDARIDSQFKAGQLAYQLGQPCGDHARAWLDGWYSARNENMHLREDWASLFPHSGGFVMRSGVLEFA